MLHFAHTPRDPYRSPAPEPPEPDYRRAWRERWRDYALLKNLYRLSILAVLAPWIAALAGISFPATLGLWLVTLGPVVVPVLGYCVTQFACPRCSGAFTGSDFFGIPDGGAVPFWMGIFPSHCASCDVEVGSTHGHAPAEAATPVDPAEVVPAIGRRLRTMKRLGLLTLVVFGVTAAFLSLLEPRGPQSVERYGERIKH